MNDESNLLWKDLGNNTMGIVIEDNSGQTIFISSGIKELSVMYEMDHTDFIRLVTSKSERVVMPFMLSVGSKTLLVQQTEGEIYGAPVRIFTVWDYTAYISIQKEWYIYKTFLDEIFDGGIMICDDESKIILFNTASVITDGTPKEMVLGKKFGNVYQYKEKSNLIKTLQTGEAIVNEENIYYTHNGKKVVSFGSTYPIKKENKTVAAIATIQWHSNIFTMLNKMLDFQKKYYNQNVYKKNNTRYTFDDIIGESKVLTATINKAKRAANSVWLPVCIYGETGTGKELFAQSIHNASIKRDQPFVAINCAAIPESLLESTLFGTVKGAFTGAENTTGLFEAARDGTLFLDEINLMPVYLQSKLLRVLQEKTYKKIGSNIDEQAACRIIVATNRPPTECIKDNTLRMDLYYRISVISINIPPLRERKGDIPLLASYFLQKYNTLCGDIPINISAEYLNSLCKYNWPGNVRELQNTIESSLVMLDPGMSLTVRHLPPHIGNISEVLDQVSQPEVPESENDTFILKDALEQLESQLITRMLCKNDWNIARTAKCIGISRSNLQYRMNRLGIVKVLE